MSWLKNLKAGLEKTSRHISSGITSIFATQKPTSEQLEELEDLLIVSDVGPEVAHEICQHIAHKKVAKDNAAHEVLQVVADFCEGILAENTHPHDLFANAPSVILVCGINGSGKTTTIGKLIPWLQAQGKSVRVVAADTFRAAAVGQLQHWCNKAGVPIEVAADGADPAALAYRGFETAQKLGEDVLLIDTAGRLHNKIDLMEELAKIQRVLQKLDPSAPHHGLLVLDATGGQNLLQQVETFQKFCKVSGLIITKMDGTAKGGIVLNIARKHKLVPLFVGVGEGVDDLQPFDAKAFSQALVGLDSQ